MRDRYVARETKRIRRCLNFGALKGKRKKRFTLDTQAAGRIRPEQRNLFLLKCDATYLD